jgi:hypothetical protein
MARALPNTAVPIPEASIQATVKQALETLGYTVLEIAKGRSAKAAGAWTGTTPGTPDLFVSHAAWGEPTWIGIELKTKTGRVRPEQQALADKGLTKICRSVYEALFAIMEWEYARFLSRPAWEARHNARYKKLIDVAIQFADKGGVETR